MEPHPLPQQILDVEFKLFGSFSLKQFVKILVAISISFLLYFLEPIPIFIRFFLIGVIVLLGFLFAIIPRFEVKFFNFLKAVFISPRYVWIREYKIPEILQDIPESTSEKLNTVYTSTNTTKKIQINEIPFEEIFKKQKKETQVNIQNQQIEDEEDFMFMFNDQKNSNVAILDYYDKVFQGYKNINQNNDNEIKQLQTKENVTTQRFNGESEFKPTFSTLNEYLSEIKRLKFELSKISHSPNNKDLEDKIMNQIQKLIQEIKIIQSLGKTEQKAIKTTVKGNKVSIKPIQNQGKVIFGIVVDRSDRPIPNATISFLQNENIVQIAKSDNKGRFFTQKPLDIGEYEIKISDSGVHKFNTYKITVTQEKPPAYKLRSK